MESQVEDTIDWTLASWAGGVYSSCIDVGYPNPCFSHMAVVGSSVFFWRGGGGVGWLGLPRPFYLVFFRSVSFPLHCPQRYSVAYR